MRFEVQLGNEPPRTFMRKTGYSPETSRQTKQGELAFHRSIRGGAFPKFHIYCTELQRSENLSLTIHLDQKAPSYKGSSAHSGEYEGPLLVEEMERIKQIASSLKTGL